MKTGSEPIRVFIAYSRQDKDLLNRLLKVLKTLIRKGIIEVWHDGKIPIGSEWDREIKAQLNSADIIVPLLSADSLASDYFHDDEMQPAFIRYYAGTCCIIPVVLNYCGWEDTRFESIQLLPLLPSNKKFLPLSDWDNYDKAFNEIRKEIRVKAKGMRAERKRKYEEHLQAIEAEKERKRKEEERIAREKREAEARKIAEAESRLRAIEAEKERKRKEEERIAREKREAEARRMAEAESRLRAIEAEKERKRKEEERIAREKREAEARRIAEAESRLQAIEAERERKRKEKKRIEREKHEAEIKKAKRVALHQRLMSDMVLVKGGIFDMGTIEKKTYFGIKRKVARRVTLDSYYISKYAVTFARYDVFCEVTGRKKPSDSDWGRGKHPVINVHWYDAVEYCNWLSEQSGLTPCYQIDKSVKDVNNKNDYDDLKWVVQCDFSVDGFRLLTEAEWEYAARGRGQKVRFGNGKNIADSKEMNFDATRKYSYSVEGEYRGRTVPVDSFSPNGLGLYNMSGNVWEWCWDWFDTYSSESVRNPKGASGGTLRVLRGGSWGSNAESLEGSFRLRDDPDSRSIYSGFRLARTLIEN